MTTVDARLAWGDLERHRLDEQAAADGAEQAPSHRRRQRDVDGPRAASPAAEPTGGKRQAHGGQPPQNEGLRHQ